VREACLGELLVVVKLPRRIWFVHDPPSEHDATKTPQIQAFAGTDAETSSAGRSEQRGEGGIADADLAALVAAWATLPEPIKAAIRALVGSCHISSPSDIGWKPDPM